MRDYKQEFENRVAFIKNILADSGAKGLVYGNSGGKDSALVGILCKAACDNTLGIIMPCSSKRNYDMDTVDAMTVAERFGIETRNVDLAPLMKAAVEQLEGITKLNPPAMINLAPRLRMISLYAVAASEQRLVVGTGNRSEAYVGYFTKWGDGAYDLNPISDLTVTEIYEFLRYLGAPSCVIEKAPSAALFDGQTDESEMGISYGELDAFLFGQPVTDKVWKEIGEMHAKSAHKRIGALNYR